jgi:hypothetical protein
MSRPVRRGIESATWKRKLVREYEHSKKSSPASIGHLPEPDNTLEHRERNEEAAQFILFLKRVLPIMINTVSKL